MKLFPFFNAFSNLSKGFFPLVQIHRSIYMGARFRIVDNSEQGKLGPDDRPPKMIGKSIKKKKVVDVGDFITVAFKGKVFRALIVGLKMKNTKYVPTFTTNNIILLDSNREPLGTKATVPFPAVLKTIPKISSKILTMPQTYI